MRKTLILLAGLVAACPAFGQSSPNWPLGFIPTPAQWSAEWASKQDYLRPLSSLYLGLGGGTLTGNLTFGSMPNAPPSFVTRSGGTRVVLYPQVGPGSTDYALGIDNGALWQSVGVSANVFRWYGGTSLFAQLDSGGFEAVPIGANVPSTGRFTSIALNGNLGGWSLFNLSKGMILAPYGTNPAYGIVDSAGLNPWAMWDSGSAGLRFSSMPPLSDSATPPNTVLTLSPASVAVGAHVISTGSAPVLSGCGAAPSISATATDVKGTITEGASATGCVASFGTAFGSAPDCVVSSPTGSAFTSFTPSATALTIVNASASGNKYTYFCIQ